MMPPRVSFVNSLQILCVFKNLALLLNEMSSCFHFLFNSYNVRPRLLVGHQWGDRCRTEASAGAVTQLYSCKTHSLAGRLLINGT